MSVVESAGPARSLRGTMATAAAVALALFSSVAALKSIEGAPLGVLAALGFACAEFVKLALPDFARRMRAVDVRSVLFFAAAVSFIGSILFVASRAPTPGQSAGRSWASMSEYVDRDVWERTNGCRRMSRSDVRANDQCSEVPDELLRDTPAQGSKDAIAFWFWIVVALQMLSLSGPFQALRTFRPARAEPCPPPLHGASAFIEQPVYEPAVSPAPPLVPVRLLTARPEPITVEFEDITQEPSKEEEPVFSVKQRVDEVSGEGFVLGASIKPQPIEWLWPGVLMIGALNVLSGQGGVGKSSIAASIAALASKSGSTWPTGEPVSSGAVVFCEVEDDLESVVTPRLMACGANMERIVLRGTPIDLSESIQKFIEFVDRMERHCGSRVRLAVFSPVRMFFGPSESYNNQLVRKRIDPLLKWAQKRGVCILGIHHPTEGKAFGGSAAWVEVARCGLFAEWSAGEGSQRYVRPLKSNNAQVGWRLPYGTVGAAPLGYETSRIVWGEREFIGAAPATPSQSENDESVKGGETMPRPAPREKPLSAEEKAGRWILAILADGPKDRSEFEADRVRDGIGESALESAAKANGIERDELDEQGRRRKGNVKKWCTAEQYAAREKAREEHRRRMAGEPPEMGDE